MGVEVRTPPRMQTAVEVRKCQDVVAIANDKNARGNAYVVTDALGAAVLCTQRLPVAAQWLNANVCPHDKVNVASLYESALHKRLAHRRFAVMRTVLASAPRAFAEARAEFPAARAVVLTMPHRVTLA